MDFYWRKFGETHPVSPDGKRGTFSTGWGAVLATAGVAIGLGNIWRFPYMMGKYGGAVFLLAYLLIIVAMGIPALMAEWTLGRYTQRGTFGAFSRAGVRGGHWISRLLLLTVTMAASYYGVVLASVLHFAVAFGMKCASTGATVDVDSLPDGFAIQFAFVMVTVGLGCGMLFFGVRSGIEKTSKIALPLFFILFVILILRVNTLEGAVEGMKSFLTPRPENFTGSTALAAMGQAFFSLGLGGTFMVVYGSYMRADYDIPKGAILTACADVMAALMAGLIVVPAAIALQVPLESGPALLFKVMPEVFGKMPAGDFFGAAFFASVFVVALLSLIAAYEVIVAGLSDGLGWSRRRSLTIIFVSQLLLSLPALLIDSYIGTSDLIWGTTMQPVGAVFAIVALTWFVKKSAALTELRSNTKLPVPDWLFLWMKYVIPLGIVATLVYGWVDR